MTAFPALSDIDDIIMLEPKAELLLPLLVLFLLLVVKEAAFLIQRL
jgi:hypothetical protein